MHRTVRAIMALFLAIAPVAGAVSVTVDAERIVTGLDHPWNIAFLPDGRWLVTERGGRLRVVRDGVLHPQPVAGVPAVYAASQGGLFDVLPAPDFARSRRLYLSYAHGTADANATRVAHARLDGERLVEVTPIFTASPWKDTPVHYGGRMAWLGDGTLLLTLGDGFDYREEAQNVGSHLGTIVRIHADGRVPDDNPLRARTGALPEIFTFGNRNVQGIAVDTDSGRIHAHEHGPRGGDELNRLIPGRNYGWPVATHGIDYSGAIISPYTERPGTEPPLLVWTPSIAPSDMMLYRGSLFEEWRGDLLVSALVEKSIRRIDLDDEGRVVGQSIVYRGDARIRGVREAPDGSLVVLIDASDGALVRLRPRR